MEDASKDREPGSPQPDDPGDRAASEAPARLKDRAASETPARLEDRASSGAPARLDRYLLSFPERTLRSAAALSAGLLRQVGETALPEGVRRTRLYRSMVDATLRFLIESVGEVEGVYDEPGGSGSEFFLRRSAGNGLELLGILAFRASPVWVLAALSDLSGTGRSLVREISVSLKEEGLLSPDREFETADQILDGLEATAGRLAEAVNTPPLNFADLRLEWEALRADAKKLPPASLPSPERLTRLWSDIRGEAEAQQRSSFQIASALAVSAAARVPGQIQWLSRSAGTATRKTGAILAGGLLDHYRTGLENMRASGFRTFWDEQYGPYLRAAADHFSRRKRTATDRLLDRERR